MSTTAPGPWKVDYLPFDVAAPWAVRSQDDQLVATKLTEPNARLIATGPEMLRALVLLTTATTLWERELAEKLADEVIAKAEGLGKD